MVNKNKMCAITSCGVTSKSNPNEKFILFPKFGTEKYYLWLEKTNLNLNRGEHVLCKRHFSCNSFDSKERLKRNVLPSLHLNNCNSSVIVFSPKAFQDSNEDIINKNSINDKCAILHTPSTSNTLLIHDQINLNFTDEPGIEFSLESCLVCLEAVGIESIYENSEISIAEQIQSFTDIIIKLEDGLPNSVCLACAVKINNCYNLKKQCLNSIKLFTNMLQKKENRVLKNCDKLKIDINSLSNLDNENKTENLKLLNVEENNQFCSIFLPDNKIIDKVENVDKTDSLELIKDDSLDYTSKKMIPLEKENINQSSVIVEGKTCIVSNCNDCGKVFQTNKSLKEHKILHTNKTTYECDKCNKKFQQKIKLLSHQRWHKKQNIYICEICSRQYKSIQSLNHHKLVHGEPKYKCDECNKMFYTPNGKRDHVKRHAQKKEGITYSCDKCNKTLSCKAALLMHQKSIHLGVKLFKCVICGKEYFNSYNYQFHIRRHTGEKPYSCDFCEENFSQRPILNRHLEKKHNIKKGTKSISETDQTSLQCQICKKQLSCLQKFTEHMRIHSGEKPYECKFCKKSFRVSQALVCHLRIHTGEKPFHCKFCPGKFKTLSHSIQHERQHTGLKPYKCSICDKAFSNSGYLRIHSRVHSGEKPYNCDQCDKKFTTSGNRDAHIRVHTGEKPYSCVECDSQFIRLKYLKQHIDKEHTNNINGESENNIPENQRSD